MEGIKKILVASDLSEYSKAALRLGATLAEALGAQMRVVSVINQRDIDAVRFIANTTSMVDPEKYLEERRQDRMGKIEELLTEANCGGLPVEKVIRVGVPWEEVLKEVDEWGADLLIIGTKGRTNAARLLYGSNAEKIYRHCPVSVLSARGQSHAELVCRLRDA